MMEKELEDRWEVLAEEQAARWELLRVRTAAFCAVCEEREPFDRMPIAKEEVAARREIEVCSAIVLAATFFCLYFFIIKKES